MERTMDALLLENSENDRRLRWAVSCAAAGLWCLPALTLSLPKGLLPFGVLLLASTLLVPLRIGHAARQIGVDEGGHRAHALVSMPQSWLSA